MEQLLNKRNVVIVAHKFLPQPDDDLVLFLNQQKRENVLHIYHDFSDMPERRSHAVWYRNGEEWRRMRSADYRWLPEPLVYVKEMVFTWGVILRSRKRWHRYIGMDGLCVWWGNGLRFFGLVEKTIYWAIDFVPEKRFGSQFKNWVYHAINIAGYRHSDEMWDLSPRMAEAREKFLGVSMGTYRQQRVVPFGLWWDRIKRYSYSECQRSTLVFMGHLIEKQGVQQVIEALPMLIQKIPHFRFKIIGEGIFRDALMSLAEKRGVLKYCDFYGKIPTNTVVEEEIAKSAVAIAPYMKSLDTWTYYADPGKVKSYLACGVPVVLTDLPWNTAIIQERECGLITTGTPEDIAEKVAFLMNEKRNNHFRSKAIEYSKNFDYKNIFSEREL